MAVDTSRYSRRKKDADAALAFQLGSAGDLSQAVRAIDDEIKSQAKLRADQARQAMLDAERQADREAVREDREAVREDRATMRAGQEADRQAKMAEAERKRGLEEQERRRKDIVSKATSLQSKQRGDSEKGFITASELAALAGKDMTPEELLSAVEGINQEAFDKERKFKSEQEKSARQARLDEARIRKLNAPPRPPDPLDRRLKEAKIKEAEANAAQASRGKPLEAAAVKEIGELRATLSAIDDLAKRNPSVGTGFFRSVQNTLAQVAGIDDPKVTKFRADTANLINEIISRLSGANVPPAEMERIAQGIPQFFDDDVAYDQKLQATRARVQRALDAAIQSNKAAGRDVVDVEAMTEWDALPDAE